MRFDEFELYAAIHDVSRELPSPGSDDWICKDREKMLRLVFEKLPLRWRDSDRAYTAQEAIDAWKTYRKSSMCGDWKKLELAVIVGRRYGVRCFWAGRIRDDCSSDIQVDRLIPGSRGGLYVPGNCVLACGHHNNLRSDMEIESFLREFSLRG